MCFRYISKHHDFPKMHFSPLSRWVIKLIFKFLPDSIFYHFTLAVHGKVKNIELLIESVLCSNWFVVVTYEAPLTSYEIVIAMGFMPEIT